MLVKNFTLSVLVFSLLNHKVFVDDASFPYSYHNIDDVTFSLKFTIRTCGTSLAIIVETLGASNRKYLSPRHPYRRRLVLLYLAALLLCSSHYPEPNPGPQNIQTAPPPPNNQTSQQSESNGSCSNNSYPPCGVCQAAVDWNCKGVACDTCNTWYHAHCQNIGDSTYAHLGDEDLDLSWHCAPCGTKNNDPCCPSHELSNSICPCGVCSNLVKSGERGVTCKNCGLIYHAGCQSVYSTTFTQIKDHSLPWYCAICGNPNSQTMYWPLLDDTTVNSKDHTDLLGERHPIPKEADCAPKHSSTPSRASQQNKWKHRPLRILSTNMRSVTNKKVELTHAIDRLRPDVIILTETWLDGKIKDSEFINTNHYKVYRKDRNRSGGGVLIAINNDLENSLAPELGTDCEIVWAKIKLKGRRTLYVCAYYRHDVSDEDSLTKFGVSLERAVSIKNAHLLISGDFNFPSWDWTSMRLKPNPSYSDLHKTFIDMLADNGVEQVVKEATREANVLDLIITNQPQLVPRIEVQPGLSDHDLVFCEFNINPQKKMKNPHPIPLYNKADWDSFKKATQSLSNSMQEQSKTEPTESLWAQFKTTMLENIKKFIPSKMTSNKVKLPWVTPEIQDLMHKRDKAYSRMKKTGSDEDKRLKNNLRRVVQRKLRRSYWSYLNDIFEEEEGIHETKNKKFWRYMYHQQMTKTGISPLKKDGKLYTNPKSQADILNQQFQSAFSEGNKYTLDEFKNKTGMQEYEGPAMKKNYHHRRRSQQNAKELES